MAGIEDGFDKGRALIRVDAGSLFSLSLRLLCALLCQDLQTTKSSHLQFLAYLELSPVDQLDKALPDPPKLVLSWCGQEVIQVPLRRSF